MNNLSLKSFSESVGKTMGVAAIRSGFALKALTTAFLVLGGATACGSDQATNGPVATWNDAGNDGSGNIDGNTRRPEPDAGSSEPDAGGDGGPDPEDTAKAVKKLITVACPSFQKAIDEALKKIDGECPIDDAEIKNLDSDILNAAKGYVDTFMSNLNSGKYKLQLDSESDGEGFSAYLLNSEGHGVHHIAVYPGNDEPGSGIISIDNNKIIVSFRRAGGGENPYESVFHKITVEEGGMNQHDKCPEDENDPLRRMTLNLVGEHGGDGGDTVGGSSNHIGVTNELYGPYTDTEDPFTCSIGSKSLGCVDKDYNEHASKVLCSEGTQIITVTTQKGMTIEGSNALANKILALLKPLVEALGSKQSNNGWKTIDFQIKNP